MLVKIQEIFEQIKSNKVYMLGAVVVVAFAAWKAKKYFDKKRLSKPRR